MTETTMQRRRYLVSCRHQLPHVIGITLLAAVNSIVLVFVLAWVFMFRFDTRFAAPISEGFLGNILLALVAISIISVIWSLRHTRALAGLLHKVTKVLQDGQHGRIPAGEVIRFRKDDAEFCDLERELNATVHLLRNTTSTQGGLLAALEKLEHDLESEHLSPKDATTRIRTIRQQLAQGGSRA
jgi:hypothetical protein